MSVVTTWHLASCWKREAQPLSVFNTIARFPQGKKFAKFEVISISFIGMCWEILCIIFFTYNINIIFIEK